MKAKDLTISPDDGHVVPFSHTGIRREGTPQETGFSEKEGKRRLDVLKAEYALSQPRSNVSERPPLLASQYFFKSSNIIGYLPTFHLLGEWPILSVF